MALVVIPQASATEIPDTIQGDRQLITEMAPVIRNLWARIDNAQVYIEAGRKFEPLHDRLSKNSCHDRKRIGWYRAFQEERFGCSRQDAEACIKIYRAFGNVANAFATSKLPQTLGALHMLARLELSPAVLARRLLREEITPKTSVRAIRKLGESIGRFDPKSASEKSQKSLPTWAGMTAAERLQVLTGAKAHEILKVCEPAVVADLEKRGEQALELKKRVKQATRPRLLPAPDRHVAGGLS